MVQCESRWSNTSNSSSGVFYQQSVGFSPGLDTCVPNQLRLRNCHFYPNHPDQIVFLEQPESWIPPKKKIFLSRIICSSSGETYPCIVSLQVQGEFSQQCEDLTSVKLIEMFSETKGTGKEKPGTVQVAGKRRGMTNIVIKTVIKVFIKHFYNRVQNAEEKLGKLLGCY